MRAALDTEIELKADGLVRIASVRKQRDMENGKKVAFTLEVVELGMDEDLEGVTSCVVSTTDVPRLTAKKQKLTGLNEVTHQALFDAIDIHSRRFGGSEHYPSSQKVVEAPHIYSEFKLRRTSDKITSEAMRKSCNRARDWLQTNDYVREYDNKIWLIDDLDRHDK